MTDQPQALDQTPIEELQLSMRAFGFLKRTQIHAIADLLHYTQEDLRLLDPESAAEVMNALEQKFGITLDPSDELI